MTKTDVESLGIRNIDRLLKHLEKASFEKELVQAHAGAAKDGVKAALIGVLQSRVQQERDKFNGAWPYFSEEPWKSRGGTVRRSRRRYRRPGARPVR